MESIAPDRLERQARALVERLGGRWWGSGGLCRCPAHEDRSPSLSVRPGLSRLLFHCFAGCPSAAVLDCLRGLGLAASGEPALVGAPSAKTAPDPDRNRRAARRLWAASRPLAASPAQDYLRRRGLLLTAPDLRYHPHASFTTDTRVRFGPALVAAVREGGCLVAVHRTFLMDRPGEARRLRAPKRALGRLGGGAVQLSPPRGGLLGWAEGIENALAAMQLTGLPCWATLGTERFARVALPAGIERLTLFLDNDAGGRRAEALARVAHGEKPLEIEARYPATAGADWNDVLLGRVPG